MKVSRASHPEPRRSKRQVVVMAVMLLGGCEGGRTEQEAYLLDLSEHGARVQPGVAFSPGQVVTLIPSESPGYGLPARIVWVGGLESDHAGEAGLEFLRPLPATV